MCNTGSCGTGTQEQDFLILELLLEGTHGREHTGHNNRCRSLNIVIEAGDFILAGITTKELLNATDMAIEMKQKGVLGKPCPDYVDETVSMKVVRIIQGYVNVVNKMVWRKDQ